MGSLLFFIFLFRTRTPFFPAVLPHLRVETEVLAAQHSVRSTLVHTSTAVLATVADSLPLCIIIPFRSVTL